MKRLHLLAALLAGALATPTLTRGQGSAPERATPTERDAPQPLRVRDATKLRGGVWRYVNRVVAGADTQDVGARTLLVVPATFERAPAWLVVELSSVPSMPAASGVDSIYLSQSNLAPLYRAMHFGAAELVSRFTPDSITGHMTLPQGVIPIAFHNQPGIVVNGASLELALRLTPLARGWQGTADLLAVSRAGATTDRVALRVVGEQRVTVPAGTFDAWMVELSGAPSRQRIWVDKRSGDVVKLTITGADQPALVAETVLVEERTR
jgi:hypothetical protein